MLIPSLAGFPLIAPRQGGKGSAFSARVASPCLAGEKPLAPHSDRGRHFNAPRIIGGSQGPRIAQPLCRAEMGPPQFNFSQRNCLQIGTVGTVGNNKGMERFRQGREHNLSMPLPRPAGCPGSPPIPASWYDVPADIGHGYRHCVCCSFQHGQAGPRSRQGGSPFHSAG